ncbi:MAG TPA: hypothetical protein VMZ28_18510 [Kofleriaceae bacterium]|nr:hypothetical protein [Kofleriaceae bacterium]
MTRLCALIALAATVAGCKKEKVPDGKLTPEVTALLAHLPADATVVVGMNLARARESALYQKLLPRLTAAAPGALATLKEVCKLDVINDLQTVVASVGDDLDDRGQLHFVAKGSFTKDKVAACVGEMSKGGSTIATGDEEELTWYSDETGKTYAYWPAPDTVAVTGQRDGAAERLAQVAASGGAVKNAGLMKLIAKADTTAAFWAAGPLPAEVRQQMGDATVVGFFLSVVPDDDRLKVLLAVEAGSEDVASSTAAAIREKKDGIKLLLPDPKLGAIVGRMEVLQDGVDVAVRVSLSAEEVDHLMGLTSMLPGAP